MQLAKGTIMNKDKCVVLLNTCDKYEDAWYPFFELIKKYWKGCNFPFYLNAESKSYSHDGINLTTINWIGHGENVNSWGARLLNCLNQIDSEYVILLLEDFFLQSSVDETELEKCIKKMDNNPDIVAIYFKSIFGFKSDYSEDSKYYIMKEELDCKLNLQAGLWRKKELQKLVLENDSPWTFEEEGYRRVNSNQVFLCSKVGTHTNYEGCVFPYLTARHLGFGIWGGKWLWNNDKLFKENGIQIKGISLERFTKFDLFKYYCRRAIEKVSKKK